MNLDEFCINQELTQSERMAELGKKDRCCRCHHPLSECPYFEDNGKGMTEIQKSRICDMNAGIGGSI